MIAMVANTVQKSALTVSRQIRLIQDSRVNIRSPNAAHELDARLRLIGARTSEPALGRFGGQREARCIIIAACDFKRDDLGNLLGLNAAVEVERVDRVRVESGHETLSDPGGNRLTLS